MDNKSHVPVTTDVRIFQQALESLDHGDLGIPHFRKLPFVAMETEEHHQTSNKQGMIGVVKTWNQMLQVPGAKIPLFQKIIQMWRSIPIGSMYAIYGNIYHTWILWDRDQPVSVSKKNIRIHGVDRTELQSPIFLALTRTP